MGRMYVRAVLSVFLIGLVVSYSDCTSKVSFNKFQPGTLETNTGNPFTQGTTSVLEAICTLIKSCQPQISYDACLTGVAATSGISSTLGFGFGVYDPFSSLINAENANVVSANMPAANSCVQAISTLSCTDPNVVNAYNVAYSNPYLAVPYMMPLLSCNPMFTPTPSAPNQCFETTPYLLSQLGIAGQVTSNAGVAFDSNGNSYSTGYANGAVLGGALGTQIGTHGTNDGYISKYDPNGNLVWVNQIGAAAQVTNPGGIAVDPAGNLYEAGATSAAPLGGAQGTQFGTHGTTDLYVSKFASNGSLVWSAQVGGAGLGSVAGGTALDSTGNIYVGGYTAVAGLGGGLGLQYGAHGTEDAVVSKFDNNGNLIWVRQLGVAGAATNGYGLASDSAGNSYLTGTTFGAGLGGVRGTQFGAHGTSDSFFAKFDVNGNLIWVRQLGFAGVQTVGIGIAVDASGNSYTSGWTIGSVLGGAQGAQYGTHGTQDVFVSKLDSNGNLIWVRQLGLATTQTSGTAISVDAAGNSYSSGETTGSVVGGALGTQYGTHGVTDALVSKLDTNGNLIWVSQLGAVDTETWPQGIAFNSCGTVYLTGWLQGDIGGTEFGSIGTEDSFNIVVNPATGTFQ